MTDPQLFTVHEDHQVIPSRDWMKQGFYAQCKCGVGRCTVLIERGDIPPWTPERFEAWNRTPEPTND